MGGENGGLARQDRPSRKNFRITQYGTPSSSLLACRLCDVSYLFPSLASWLGWAVVPVSAANARSRRLEQSSTPSRRLLTLILPPRPSTVYIPADRWFQRGYGWRRAAPRRPGCCRTLVTAEQSPPAPRATPRTPPRLRLRGTACARRRGSTGRFRPVDPSIPPIQ